jgi:hypothetical protein
MSPAYYRRAEHPVRRGNQPWNAYHRKQADKGALHGRSVDAPWTRAEPVPHLSAASEY